MDATFEIDEDLLKDLEELEENPEEEQPRLLRDGEVKRVKEEFEKIYGSEKADFIDKKISGLEKQGILKSVSEILNQSSELPEKSNSLMEQIRLVIRANELLRDVISEIQVFIANTVSEYFPDLESLVYSKEQYIKCLSKMLDCANPEMLDLADVLDNHLITPVILAFKNSTLMDLPEHHRSTLQKGCQHLLRLETKKEQLISFIESHMNCLAPNTSQIVGPAVTAKLISKSGGLKALASTPSCNIQMIGHERKNLVGLSKHGKIIYVGFIGECGLVTDVLDEKKMKMIKLVSNAVAKAARVDLASSGCNRSYGGRLAAKIEKDFAKYFEPKTGQAKQPLKLSDDGPKRRRGGKKFRKIRDKFGLTEARLQKNRLKFGTDFSQDMVLNGKEDRGMLGQSGIGRALRVKKKIKKMNLTQRQKQNQKLKINQASGTVSSLVFSSNKALQLLNPDAHKKQIEQSSGVFNKPSRPNDVFGNTGFRTVYKQRNQGL